MRNISLLLLVCSLLTVSCSKSHDSPDNGCIERVVLKQSDIDLTASQIKTADSLLDVNHIDHSRYKYIYQHSDSMNGHFQQVVMVDQYVNGLRLFSSPLTYIFSDGTLTYNPSPTNGTTLDTISLMPLSRLRALFTRDIKRSLGVGAHFLTDSCYKAELGYYNTAAYNAPETLVRAWRVSIKHTDRSASFGYFYDVPYAYYNDGDGKLVAFGGILVPFE